MPKPPISPSTSPRIPSDRSLAVTTPVPHEFGVFLPVANGGWIISSTTPPLDGLWKQNLAAAVTADQVGMDFVMSMGKWRGFGGQTNHWGVQMESLTMMAGIAQATHRVKLWATIHPLLQNPAVAAKMITTLDHISGGRAGLNIVAGAYRGEFEQMGAWDTSLDHDDRYVLTEEWTHLIKRLWSEPSVTHEGRFFHFKDCQSNPKPLSTPHPDLICAGMSERGFDFAVREADACFIGGRTQDERRDASRRGKAAAARYGKTIKTYAMCTVVFAETDAKAEALVERYCDGVDMGAVIEMLKSWGIPPERLTAVANAQGAFMTQTAVGSPATCRDKIADFLTYCELDGLMLIFPDYVEGLQMFGADILPSFRAEAA
jgi:pyrimidine oxygenase